MHRGPFWWSWYRHISVKCHLVTVTHCQPTTRRPSVCLSVLRYQVYVSWGWKNWCCMCTDEMWTWCWRYVITDGQTTDDVPDHRHHRPVSSVVNSAMNNRANKKKYALPRGASDHRCDKRLQRLQKILRKRVYYFVNVYLNKNHMSETKQNYDGKQSYSALRSNRSLIEFIGSRC